MVILYQSCLLALSCNPVVMHNFDKHDVSRRGGGSGRRRQQHPKVMLDTLWRKCLVNTSQTSLVTQLPRWALLTLNHGLELCCLHGQFEESMRGCCVCVCARLYRRPLPSLEKEKYARPPAHPSVRLGPGMSPESKYP